MDSLQKFGKAVQTLKPNVEFVAYDKIETEEDFNKVKWVIGEEKFLLHIHKFGKISFLQRRYLLLACTNLSIM